MGTIKKYRTPGGREGYQARDSWTDRATGERRYKKMSFFVGPGRTLTFVRREAEAWLAQREADRSRGVVWEPTRESLGSLIDRWLETVGPPRSEATVIAYRSAARKRFTDADRRLVVGDMDRSHCRQIVQRWEKEKLKPNTMRIGWVVLRGAIGQALDERGIIEDPTSDIVISGADREELVVWTPKQVAAFLDSAREDPLHYAWELLLSTGVRRGELAALRWDDIEDGVLTVRRTYTHGLETKWIIADRTKRGGQRRIQLPNDVLDMLTKVLAERTHDDGGWLVSLKANEPIGINRIEHAWNVAVEKSGLPRLTMHGARHTVATIMIARMIPGAIVARVLGHASTRITFDTYTHPSDDHVYDAIETLHGLYRDETKALRAQTAPESTGTADKPQ